MPLVKISDGLIEEENFLLTSPIEDFLGNAQYSRTLEKFTLQSGTVERPFNFPEFLIEIKKEDSALGAYEHQAFFCRTEADEKVGMKEIAGDPDEPYWKMIYTADHIQVYKSADQKAWANIGGQAITSIKYQGFEVKGSTPMVISEYKVYKGPYLTIYNFMPNTKVQLLNADDTVIKERVFDSEGKVQIFLDYCMDGRLVFIDPFGEEILRTGLLHLTYGDEYLHTDVSIQMRYKGSPIGYKTTHLLTIQEVVEIENLSDTDYSGLRLTVEKPQDNTDTVEISWDDVTYSTMVEFDISAHEIKTLHIRITKDGTRPNLKLRQFDLELGGV